MELVPIVKWGISLRDCFVAITPRNDGRGVSLHLFLLSLPPFLSSLLAFFHCHCEPFSPVIASRRRGNLRKIKIQKSKCKMTEQERVKILNPKY